MQHELTKLLVRTTILKICLLNVKSYMLSICKVDTVIFFVFLIESLRILRSLQQHADAWILCVMHECNWHQNADLDKPRGRLEGIYCPLVLIECSVLLDGAVIFFQQSMPYLWCRHLYYKPMLVELIMYGQISQTEPNNNFKNELLRLAILTH